MLNLDEGIVQKLSIGKEQHGRGFDLGRKTSTIAARWNIMSAPPGASFSAPGFNYSNDALTTHLPDQALFLYIQCICLSCDLSAVSH